MRGKVHTLLLEILAPFMWLGIIVLSIICGSAVLLAFPLVRPFDPCRHSLHQIAVFWARGIARMIPRLRYRITGTTHLASHGTPVIYVANHQSQTDILALFMTGARFRWLAKAVLFRIPIFGWALHAIGYVPVDRTSLRSRVRCMKQAREVLRRGTPMMFFPEGTRSPDGILRSFKHGAFELAKEAGVPIVPITILGTDEFLPKGSLMPRKTTFRLKVHPPIFPEGLTEQQLALAAREAISSALPLSKRGTAPTPPQRIEGAQG